MAIVYNDGLPFTANGALQVLPVATVPAGSLPGGYGIYVDQSTGFACVADAGAAVPSTAVIKGGLALTPDGALYITESATGMDYYSNGFRVRKDGAVLVAAPAATDTFNGGWACALGTGARAVGGGGGDGASFAVEFRDLGAGAVNIVPMIGGVSGTFTRATAASARLSNGLWKLDVASGVPRSHYSRAGVLLGYLAEGARTQLLTGTDVRDMTTVNWVAVNGTAVRNAVGIDGASNSANTLTATSANATFLLTFVAAASSRTYSAFIRRVTGTGPIEMTQDGVSWTAVTIDSAYPEAPQQLNANQLNAVIGIRVVSSGDVVVVDYNQFEAGAFASTPIPIATVTRNADVLSYPTSPWFNQSAGTVFWQAFVNNQNSGDVLGINDGTGNERYRMNVNTTPAVVWLGIDGGAGQFTLTSNVTNLAVTKAAGVYAANDAALVTNGGTPQVDATVTLPTVTQIEVGLSSGGNNYFGTISRIAYFPSRLTNVQLQALTA